MQPNEQVIRKFAHQIWESEGKPEGQAARHWEMACKLATGELGPADPFEPLSNINTYVLPADQDNTTQATASAPQQAKSRPKAKAVIDDPDAAPKKRASRASKTTQQQS
jgi:hypothetical protein